MLRPHRACSTFGICDFIRVPSPAARTMTATGRGSLTRQVSSGIAPTSAVGFRGHRLAEPPAGTVRIFGFPDATANVFTHPSSAGYRPVAMIGRRFRDGRADSSSRVRLQPRARRAAAVTRRLSAQPGSFRPDFVTAGDCPFPSRLGRTVAPLARVRQARWARGRLRRPPRPARRRATRAPRAGRACARPVSSEATAASTLAAMANANATPRPSWNGAVIRCGKNWRPVT